MSVVVNSAKRTRHPGHPGVFEGAPALLFLRGLRAPGGLRAPRVLRAPGCLRAPGGLCAPDHLSEFEEALQHNNLSGWLVGTSDILLVNNRHHNCNHIWS